MDGVAFYISEQLEGLELHTGMEEMIESWCVRIKGRAGTGAIVGGSATSYMLPDQEV